MVVTRGGISTQCERRLHSPKIRKIKYILNRHVKRGGDNDKYECVMCYGNMSNKSDLIRCPECKSIFHWKCWSMWYRSSDVTSCPVCRNGFDDEHSDNWDFHKDMLLK